MAMSRDNQPEIVSSNGSSLFTVEEIDARIQQLLAENSELRNTLQQNNTYMRLLINTLTEWHGEIARIQGSYHAKYDDAKRIIAELKRENSFLKQKHDLVSTQGHLSKDQDLSVKFSTQEFPETLDSFELIDDKPVCSTSNIANNMVFDHPNNSNIKKQLLDLTTDKEVFQDLSNLSDLKSHHHEKLLSNGSQKIPRLYESASKQKREMFHSIERSDKNPSQHEHQKVLELEKTNDVLNQRCRELSDKISSLNARLSTAEELVLRKQTQNTELLMEVACLEKSAEVIPILKAQLELYQSDFEAEREARQNLAGEKDALALELRLLKRKLEELQVNPASSQTSIHNLESPQNPQSYECPKCSFKYSTYESLNNHLDECLNQQMFPV